MVNPQLINYINSALSKGFSLQQIKQKLLMSGYSEYDVNLAIMQVHAQKPQYNEPQRMAPAPQQFSQEPVEEKEGMSGLAKVLLILVIIFIVGPFIIGILIVLAMLIIGMFAVASGGGTQTTTTEEVGGGVLTTKTTIDSTTMDSDVFMTACNRDDFSCFRGAIDNCELASLEHGVKLDMFGINVTQDYYMEIRGRTEGTVLDCDIYTKIVDVNVDFKENTPEDFKQQFLEYWEPVKGAEDVCSVNSDELFSVMNDWSSGDYSETYLENAQCETGTLTEDYANSVGESVAFIFETAFEESGFEKT